MGARAGEQLQACKSRARRAAAAGVGDLLLGAGAGELLRPAGCGRARTGELLRGRGRAGAWTGVGAWRRPAEEAVSRAGGAVLGRRIG